MKFAEKIFVSVTGSIISALIIYLVKTFRPHIKQLWRHIFMEPVVIKDFDDGPPCFGMVYRYKKWRIGAAVMLLCVIIAVIVLLVSG